MADNMISAALSRQKGLMKELTSLANNIANADTAGYRGEGVLFSEYVKALEGSDSLSMTRAHARTIDLTQGDIITTNGTFDLAISGEGFFLVETPEGSRLTRAGAFTTNELGELVDGEGRRVLNNGEGPIAIPEGVSSVSVNSEGDVVADGQNLARLAVVNPDELGLVREGLNLFRAENGYTPSQDFKVLQGAVEGSNVDSMTEFVRLIEVQRMYEGTKGFLDKEAERLQGFVDTVRRTE